ncbi:O-antigen ligase family protein [Microbacter sp. GSS18]|nr:O-antigen ligase family protein [Microbacter sp. GSS18]
MRHRALAGVLLFTGAWVGLSGWILVRDPWLGVAFGLAPLAVWTLLRFSWARLIAVVGGGLAVLGSSSELSITKFIYAGVIVFCAVISTARIASDPPPIARVFRPLIWTGSLFLFTVIVGALISPEGFSVATFGRQIIFYALIVLGPIVGIDAGRELSPRVVYAVLWLVGIVAAVGFAVDWLDRRGVTSLPFGRFVLSSLILPGMVFALALVLVAHRRRILSRAIWLLAVVVIPVAMLITGTRTNLIIFGTVPLVMGRLRNSRVPLPRMIVILSAAALVGLAAFPLVESFLINDPHFIDRRLAALLTVVDGNAAQDQSYSWRSLQYASAWELIQDHPLVGLGLGWTLSYTIDSPLLSVVRLGWLGVLTMTLYLVSLGSAVWRSRKLYGPSPAITAFWGLIGLTVLSLPFGTPLEDRGFGFAIMLITMAISAEVSQRPSTAQFVTELRTGRRQKQRGREPAAGTAPYSGAQNRVRG